MERRDADADSLRSVGLSTDSPLVASMRQCVVRLASGTDVLASVQSVAQSLLTTCWPILLPTTDERVTALSALLPVTAGSGIIIIINIVIIIFRPHYSTTYVDAACCYRWTSVVCLSIRLSVTLVSPS